ncbi:hypothetical protein OUZ56_016788 [Daphnia magna]|uniref:Uncharacterized protein n=1 Tax=Daphnia magna TaxID=35525 RepID=A0ABR0ARK3_9CRUS|nr:hypothetical protein OUZ56_016788 [Daphnia magna]
MKRGPESALDESPSGELPELGSVGVVPWSLQTLSEFGMRKSRWGEEHTGQGWLLRFKESNHSNSSPHLESNTDLKHHLQKDYTYAIDNNVNIHRQLEHKLNCFVKQHYQAQALNFQLSF